MKQKRVIAMVIAVVLGLSSVLLFSGCENLNLGSSGGGNPGSIDLSNPGNPGNPGSTDTPQPSHKEEEIPDYEPVVKPIVEVPDVLVPTASGKAVEDNDRAIIDYSNKQDGYIMAKYLEVTDMTVKILITVPNGDEYQYVLRPNRDFEAFPLPGGDGRYEIRVFKQVEGTKYSMVLSTSIDVVLVDEFAPFLRPNQFVDFDQDSSVVIKAAELVAGKSDFMDKVGAIYHYVINNIVYDVQLAETVQIGYIPEIDKILASGKGICFDYAALMTAMLRSQGIPTKMVHGYTGNVYHAWISVYSEEDGWLDDVIIFNGSTWALVDPTFAASGSSETIAQYIGDGANYFVKFWY